MLVYPLAADERDIVNISEAMLEKALELSDGVRHIGIGIGAIMLMIVVMYYVVTMLDGGRFQLKMLVPLVLFFFVCHFDWVAKPVLSFTTTITESLSEAMTESKRELLNPDGGSDNATINDHYTGTHLVNQEDPTVEDTEENPEEGKGEETESTVGQTNRKNFVDILWTAFKRSSCIWVFQEFATSAKYSTSENLVSERLSLAGLLCTLMSWITTAVSFCLRIFGIMMTSIVIVFGPITFAFAIMPGRGSNIVSWFIRICQFSLFAPLCHFIDAFTVGAYILLDAEAANALGYLMVFALTIANLVGLTAVPTIASMIIEGASGAVSLSHGLQTIAGAAATAGGAIVAGTVGQNNALSNFGAGMKHKGVVGFVKEMGKPTYDEAGNVNGSVGFMGAIRNIAAYGQGSIYGWNVQKDDEPPTGNAGS